jgi:hypothetical protein
VIFESEELNILGIVNIVEYLRNRRRVREGSSPFGSLLEYSALLPPKGASCVLWYKFLSADTKDQSEASEKLVFKVGVSAFLFYHFFRGRGGMSKRI